MQAELISRPRDLPSVSRLLQICAAQGIAAEVASPAIREVLAHARQSLLDGGAVREQELVADVLREATALQAPWPSRVINATGVVLHTNLGRAVLSDRAREAMLEAAGYADLELDLTDGERGRRDEHVERLLVQVTGAEAATVVNNCAAALFFALSVLASGREVVISRGQAVEIGGGFRIPDVCVQSGAVLREVGTTNRTYPSDYETTCHDDTALLLRVHRSNFYLAGFTSDVSVGEMVAIGRGRSLPVLDDLGSGCLVPTEVFGLRHEPTVQESVQAGAGLTLFSGDKLLGGPQAGIMVGKRELIERLRRHPLARALRCDKVTLAALHATLLHYLRGEHMEQVPTLRMLRMSVDEGGARASKWAAQLGILGAEVRPAVSAVGGGSLPDAELPTRALVLDVTRLGLSAEECARRLRVASRPIMARVESDLLWLDPRTVQPEEDQVLLDVLRQGLSIS